MTIDLIHVSDIHFGSGESHGRLNPETGLNIRFEDFVNALSRVVDYAIEQKIDVFLFSGDAYRNASPEPIYQKMFARELKRLSDANIQSILVVGNHDQILRSTASHAMSVFQSLEVPGVLTIDKPQLLKLNTAHGALQLIGVPHISRHHMMTIDKYRNMTSGAIDRVLIENLHDMLQGFYDELDPNLPTVSTAHLGVDRAIAGIESELLIGYSLTFPTELFIDKRVDYVALGHIHKHQVIRGKEPAVVYAGSLERVDFGEEKEDKGFIHVRLNRGDTKYEFHSINPRPFVTVDADVTKSEDATQTLLSKIKKQIIDGCVLRVRYRINQDQLATVDDAQLRQAASSALTARFLPEIIPAINRARLPQLTESAVSSPMTALETYLGDIEDERKQRLLERARKVMAETDQRLTGD